MNKKILFINYKGPISEIFNLFPDNGLALLASITSKSGYTTKILDLNTVATFKAFFPEKVKNRINAIIQENTNIPSSDIHALNLVKKELNEIILTGEQQIIQQVIEEIKNFQPGYIGFKLWSGTGTLGSFKIARKIKKHFPSVIIIGGGPQVEVFRDEILNFAPQFDYLIYGEAEISLIKLLAETAKSNPQFKSVPNLIYNDGTKIATNPKGELISFSELPEPDYSPAIYPAISDEKIKIFVIEDSRGCPNRCHFCIHPEKSGNFHRIKNAEQLSKELKNTAIALNSKFFRLAGSNPPPEHIFALSSKIKNDGYIYSTFGHTHTASELTALKESGCRAMAFGVESGSQYILENMMGKKILPEKIKKTLCETKKAGIFTIASIIFPTPLDNEKTMRETLELLLESAPDAVTVQLPGLTPETFWWDKAKEMGFNFSNKEFLKKKLLLFNDDSIIKEPLPYRIGKMKYADSLNAVNIFIEKLEKNGIINGISDFLYLCAKASDMESLNFMNMSHQIITEKNTEALESIVTKINSNINKLYSEKPVFD